MIKCIYLVLHHESQMIPNSTNPVLSQERCFGSPALHMSKWWCCGMIHLHNTPSRMIRHTLQHINARYTFAYINNSWNYEYLSLKQLPTLKHAKHTRPYFKQEERKSVLQFGWRGGRSIGTYSELARRELLVISTAGRLYFKGKNWDHADSIVLPVEPKQDQEGDHHTLPVSPTSVPVFKNSPAHGGSQMVLSGQPEVPASCI